MSLSLKFEAALSARTAYRRFLLGRRPGIIHSADLPKIEASWSGVSVDSKNLAQYRQSCAVEAEPGLPFHYPHVLVSALHLNMITEPEFPLPLLGALHLRNHAIRYRQIEPSEKLDFHAQIAECRFRPQGIEFDLDTQVHSDSELVWAERTCFLVRKKLKSEDPPSPLAEVFPWNESESPTEIDSFTVPKKAGKNYASITGDYNPIHISGILAKIFGFKRDLVHGLWGVARGTAAMAVLKDKTPVRVDIAFKGPLFMEHQVTVKGVNCLGGSSLRLFCGQDPRPSVLITLRSTDKTAKPQDIPDE